MSKIDKYPAYCKYLIGIADGDQFTLGEFLFYELANRNEMAFDIVFDDSYKVGDDLLTHARNTAEKIIKKYGDE